MATSAIGSGAHTFSYPPDIQSEKSRQQHKLKTQKENPATLFKDTSNCKGKTITTNLLFYTEHPTVWLTICKGRQMSIYEDPVKDPENRHLTVNFYQTGTVMLQGNSAALTTFEQTFYTLKDMVERQEVNPCKQSNPDTPKTQNKTTHQPMPKQRPP